MELEKIVVVRHGAYGDDSHLTPTGRQQVVGLAEAIADRLGSSKIALLSSTAPRAEQTSEILACRLGGIQFDSNSCLHSGGGYLLSEQAKEAIRLIDDRGVTHAAVILSTHLEFIDHFPTFWGRERGFDIPKSHKTPKGTARIINIKTGEVEYLVPKYL